MGGSKRTLSEKIEHFSPRISFNVVENHTGNWPPGREEVKMTKSDPMKVCVKITF